MNTVLILKALAGPAAVGLVLGMAILWDRLREPRRDPRRLVGVADTRTYRDTMNRAARLFASGEGQLAHAHLVSARTWLKYEVATVARWRKVRRVWLASQLERVELAIAKHEAPADPHWRRRRRPLGGRGRPAVG